MRSAPEHLDALMKRCQVGHARWGDLNDLLADCYGVIGGLRADLGDAEAELRRLRERIERSLQEEEGAAECYERTPDFGMYVSAESERLAKSCWRTATVLRLRSLLADDAKAEEG